ncbi:MAG TPA: hypothetical protein GXX36_10290 [Clostridiaceae bacterium]|nr:hypothetical protein [Clostridiaceae bacterium]
MKGKSKCECCVYYVFDDEYNCYACQIDLDEDEMVRFMTRSYDDCPYFRFNDEYKTARKQM